MHLTGGTPQVRLLPRYGWLAVATLAAGEAGLIFDVRPIQLAFFAIAWWSYIFFADAWVWKMRGSSLVRGRPREFWWLAFWSVAVWNLFELVNIRLQNWSYINVVPEAPIAALLCFLSFATVLPAVFETYDLLAAVGFADRIRFRPRRVAPALLAGSIAAGLGMLAAPLFWPRYAFPLAWGFAVFLIDPLCYLAGPHRAPSLLRQLKVGDPRALFRLLAAGLVCGALWEFWNFWAYTKWLYTVPYFEQVKWFEMPPLGFLGFPPFALECYALCNLLTALRRGRSWQNSSPSGPGVSRQMAIIAVALAVLFDVAAYAAISRWTVASYAPSLANIDGIPQPVLAALSRQGIHFPSGLLRRVATQEQLLDLARQTGLSQEEILTVREAARLADLKGLGAANYNALQRLGIVTVDQLAAQRAERLFPRWRAAAAERPPTAALVRIWIRAATRSVG